MAQIILDIPELRKCFRLKYYEAIAASEKFLEDKNITDKAARGDVREEAVENFLVDFINKEITGKAEAVSYNGFIDMSGASSSQTDTIITGTNATPVRLARSKSIVAIKDVKIVIETSSFLSSNKIDKDSDKVRNLRLKGAVDASVKVFAEEWAENAKIPDPKLRASVAANKLLNEILPLRVLFGLDGIETQSTFLSTIINALDQTRGDYSLFPDVVLTDRFVYLKTLGMPYKFNYLNSENEFILFGFDNDRSLDYLLDMIIYKVTNNLSESDFTFENDLLNENLKPALRLKLDSENSVVAENLLS